MKKRTCKRFNIPGTVLYYKKKSWLFGKDKYSPYYFPVVDLSKGGTKFLCDERLNPGTPVIIKLDIPGHEEIPEVLANIRWIARNPEPSYRYQTGLSFNAYGTGRKDNPIEVLHFFETLESINA